MLSVWDSKVKESMRIMDQKMPVDEMKFSFIKP
jgi:hypothetical protein